MSKIIAIYIREMEMEYSIFGEETCVNKKIPLDIYDNDIVDGICALAEKNGAKKIAITMPELLTKRAKLGYGQQREKLGFGIKERLGHLDLLFLPRVVAFSVGVVQEMFLSEIENVVCMVLDEKFDCVAIKRGSVLVTPEGVPDPILRMQNSCDDTVQNYVSGESLIRRCQKLGYPYQTIADIATEATAGNDTIREEFFELGKRLGELVEEEAAKRRIDCVIMSGKLAHWWELIQNGFEKESLIPYTVVDQFESCVLKGLYLCAKAGKNEYCKVI